MRSLYSEMTTSSTAIIREKGSRNKRKFRQDPPFSSQASSNENSNGGNNLVLSDCESWTRKPGSVEAVPSKSSISDSSNRKGSEGGTISPTSRIEGFTRSLHQDHVKLMRLRAEQAGVVQAIGAGCEWKRLESAEGHHRASEEDDDLYELEGADWDDCTESELEDLLVKTLGSLYTEAINKIVAFGHSAEEALRVVLKHGLCYGGKDAVSNIVENSLGYLTGKEAHATDGSDHSFSDLKDLHTYSLARMVANLREVRPLLSKGDAMWCLLMCDMNVPLACVMDDSALPLTNKESYSGPTTNHHEWSRVGSSSSRTLQSLCDSTLPTNPVYNSSNTRSMHLLTDTVVSSPPPTVPISPSLATSSSPPLLSVSTPDLSLLTLLDSSPHSVSREPSDEMSSNFEESTSEEGSPKVTNFAAVDDCTSSEADDLDEEDEAEEGGVEGLTSYAVTPAVASLKLSEGSDQEGFSTDSDKIGNICSSTIGESPLAIVEPSQVLDFLTEIKNNEDSEFSESKQRKSERLRADEGYTCGLHLTNNGVVLGAEKPWESVSALTNCETNGASHSDFMCVQPGDIGLVSEPREAMNSPVKFGTVDELAVIAATERVSSYFPPSESENTSSVDGTVITGETLQSFLHSTQKTDAECLINETSVSDVPEYLSKETSMSGKKGQVADQKDEMIRKLVHRSKELETQLQERIEWAKQKVMQAARRLSNDLQELKALRLERDEALRVKKDRQALEDSMMKKITDLENSLRKAKSQLDEANKSVRKLETENAEVRAEMQAAKLSAAEAQSSSQEMAKRERKSTKRAQAWEKQKAKLQEELSEEKRKIVALQQQVVLAKERQQQAEVRRRQEEKGKEDALLRADHERRAREQAESAAKKREESLRKKAESNYQRHREDIQRLESEISQFRTSAEAAHLATSRWGPGVAISPHMLELGSLQALKENNKRLAREVAELQDMARRDVHRERECVMCMCEEMSVVFLPCAHQVVCVRCNDLHEKQGMGDCPSCRTPIKQRIRVYGVST